MVNMKKPLSDRFVQHAITLQIAVVSIAILFPIFWMVLSSFKLPSEVTSFPPKFIFEPSLESYRQLFRTTPFFSYGINSLIVAVGSTVLGLVLGIPTAFAVSWSRVTWPATVTLLARMAPGALFLMPWYVMFSAFGAIGAYWVLIVTHAVITIPIIIWVLLSYFDAIPRSLFESAQVDGCPIWRILWRIALPVVMPGVVVATIMGFVFSWNYFLFSLVLSNSKTKTLIAAAFNFVGEGSTYWGALMSAATLIALPPLVLAFLVQKRLVSGLAVGAVKG